MQFLVFLLTVIQIYQIQNLNCDDSSDENVENENENMNENMRKRIRA